MEKMALLAKKTYCLATGFSLVGGKGLGDPPITTFSLRSQPCPPKDFMKTIGKTCTIAYCS